MRDRYPDPDDPGRTDAAGREATVECYSGYKGDETPRAVVIEGARLGIAEILSRKRVLHCDGGPVREIWSCRLDDGRTVALERLEDGAWRVGTPAA